MLRNSLLDTQAILYFSETRRPHRCNLEKIAPNRSEHCGECIAAEREILDIQRPIDRIYRSGIS